MTVLEVIQRSTEFLARKGIESPRLQIELLLAHVLKVPRLRLYLDFARVLTEPDLDAVRALVKRRATHEPLQHLVGSTSFCGLEMKVTPDVLIPRPETEGLAEQAWALLQARQAQEPNRPARALDVGTGTGCLAVSMAVHVPRAEIVALDVSKAALQVARENAERHRVADRMEFLESDLFAALPAQPFDLIISNPPYIARGEIDRLQPEVRDFDPRPALDGGEDGLDFFRRLAKVAGGYLAPGAALACEFGDGQAAAVDDLFQREGWPSRQVIPDLGGRARILIARRSES